MNDTGDHPDQASPLPDAHQSDGSQPLRILLADDELINRKVVMHMLKKMGYQPDCAADGSEVIEAVQNKTYDLILMDMQMPVMGGIEATERLRKQGHTMTIVALTADASTADRESAIASGMDSFLAKPISVNDLSKILSALSPHPV